MPNDKSISRLVELAKKVEMTSADKEEQRRSFVYGNISIEDSQVTREYVDEQADKLTKKS